MPTGFIYTVATVESNYLQASPRSIPVWSASLNRLVFGPCKVPIRRKLRVGDYLFGISPGRTQPRRIVFAARIAERVTYREAYDRWPELRGPEGPIHVKPVHRAGLPYPARDYSFIPGSIHADRWQRDLATPQLDAFFLCEPAEPVLGRWLGPAGPEVAGAVLDFLRGCRVHGQTGLLSETNAAATARTPIRHGRLFTGLHLETDRPESLLELLGPGINLVPMERYRHAQPGPAAIAASRADAPRRGVTRQRSGGCR